MSDPVTDFVDAQTKLRDLLQSFFGFSSFKGRQEEVVESIYSGKNTLVIMPTGAGKSLCYQLPALASEGTAIVISPLIALMKNQVDSVRAFSGVSGVAEFLNSSLNRHEIRKVQENVLQGVTKMLYVAPESLAKLDNIEFLKKVKISFVAVDEAHCISEWGHDFRPEYRKIRQMVDMLGKVPIIALTATATPKVQSDIIKNLQIPEAEVFLSSFNRPNLYYEIRPKVNAIKSIIKHIHENRGKSGIVYTLSRKKTEELAELLVANGIKAAPYHAGLDSSVRIANQDAFIMEDIDVIVATIAFGMGIDKPDVRFVIHYDIPKSIESYYQETGRAGRDGLEGVCIAFYADQDVLKLQKFMKDKPVAEKEIGNLLIDEVVSFAHSATCRRKQILHYFGEAFNEADCNQMCDSCRQPVGLEDGTDSMKILLELVAGLVRKFDSQHLLNLLTGTMSPEIEAYGHDRHPLWAYGIEQSRGYWAALLREALVTHLLTKEFEQFGIIRTGPAAEGFLSKPYPIRIRPDHDFSKIMAESDTEAQVTSVLDSRLFDMLRDLRKKIAVQKSLPPYVIFQDPSLEEMATLYPTNLQELQLIGGVGAGKASKFGAPFVDLIARYVEENEIDRPTDYAIKSTTSKSAVKVFLISGIDRKIPFADLAKSKNLSFDEVLVEIRSIIDSGTRLNIDYQLREKIDEESIRELYDYFLQMPDDDLSQAMRDLGDVYTEDEIRLVHIKFISEQGN